MPDSCWVQIGLVSWGWGCAQTNQQGEPYPGYYTNVVTLKDWIIPKIGSGKLRNIRRVSMKSLI